MASAFRKKSLNCLQVFPFRAFAHLYRLVLGRHVAEKETQIRVCAMYVPVEPCSDPLPSKEGTGVKDVYLKARPRIWP